MIETSKLLLKPFSEEDEINLVPALMCQDFMAFSPSGALSTQQAKVRFRELVEGYRINGFGKIAIILKESQQLIGYCGIEPCEIDGVGELELGYRLLKNFRGFGYATEAAKALLNFELQRGRNNIIAFTEVTNQPSINVLNKLGFKKYGTTIFDGMPVILFRLEMQHYDQNTSQTLIYLFLRFFVSKRSAPLCPLRDTLRERVPQGRP